ncbi:hypothetical protein [Parasphingorhabdus cellanae]|uniref:Uncharacterized protein n=1 Tax=Parasphingorhabdus cellanae TaxID=2806553 RepID=A0ABX7T6E1_9SPHN|nr:hypothetical protein [Parasphingorhabdus cellanae]QTD56478.1 hypothetical protein J4G78_02460 [Parasphingorhabdus cellanae]
MNNMQSKKRLLGVCRLQAKLTRRDLVHAERRAAQLEMSHAQLLAMANEMLCARDCDQSTMLAGRLEFGHRLITLSSVQKNEIAEAEKTASALRSSAHASKQREERADLNFRHARKSHHQRSLEKQPHRVAKQGVALTKAKRGFSS